MDNTYECGCEVIHKDIVNYVSSKMLAGKQYMDLASLYKMFSDSTRLKILHALEFHEMCVCDLASVLKMTKSAVSHQLKSLRLSNLVKFRREGQSVFYSLCDDHVKLIIDIGFEHVNE